MIPPLYRSTPFGESTLRIERISASYRTAGRSDSGSTKAVDNISLEIDPNTILALVGPSGGGKTSLLLAVAGLLELTSGTIAFGDVRLDQLPPHRRSIAMMFQSGSLIPHQSLKRNIRGPSKKSFVASLFEGRDDAPEIVDELADFADISNLMHRRPEQVSGGQQRRAELIRCLASENPIRLLDEPLTALDQAMANQMMRCIRHRHQQIGGITVCVTHDFETAIRVSDRVAVIADGRVMQCDAAERLANDPGHLAVARICCSGPVAELTADFFDGLAKDGEQVIDRVLFDRAHCHPPGAIDDEQNTASCEVIACRSLGLQLFELTVQSASGKHANMVVFCDSTSRVQIGRWRVRACDQRLFDPGGRRIRVSL